MGDERQDPYSLRSGPRGSPREGWGPGVREEAKKHLEEDRRPGSVTGVLEGGERGRR